MDMKIQQASPLRQAHDSRPKVPSDLPEPTVESPLYGRPDQIDTVSPGLLDESGAVQSIAVTMDSWLPRLGAPAQSTYMADRCGDGLASPQA
jgi:hypothetical protein